jgi:hypothetical protein
MSDNPFEAPKNVDQSGLAKSDRVTEVRAAYNVVTDTVTGVNTRWSDNRFQAIFVGVSILVAALIGSIVTALNSQWQIPWYGGALIGSFCGLLFGAFASGIFLMFYRTLRHLKGKHD